MTKFLIIKIIPDSHIQICRGIYSNTYIFQTFVWLQLLLYLLEIHYVPFFWDHFGIYLFLTIELRKKYRYEWCFIMCIFLWKFWESYTHGFKFLHQGKELRLFLFFINFYKNYYFFPVIGEGCENKTNTLLFLKFHTRLIVLLGLQ